MTTGSDHAFHVDLGDLPTWLAFGATFLGVVAASVAAYFVYQQLKAQREQLKIQQDEIARQVAALERQQADQVEVLAVKVTKQGGPATSAGIPATFWAVDVLNSSVRPIRKVQARIQDSGTPWLKAERIRAFSTGIWYPGTGFAVVRRGVQVGFAFGLTVQDHPDARILVRFTDDAGNDWEIDEILHLRPIRDERNW